jgi:hypothetical protein
VLYGGVATGRAAGAQEASAQPGRSPAVEGAPAVRIGAQAAAAQHMRTASFANSSDDDSQLTVDETYEDAEHTCTTLGGGAHPTALAASSQLHASYPKTLRLLHVLSYLHRAAAAYVQVRYAGMLADWDFDAAPASTQEPGLPASCSSAEEHAMATCAGGADAERAGLVQPHHTVQLDAPTVQPTDTDAREGFWARELSMGSGPNGPDVDGMHSQSADVEVRSHRKFQHAQGVRSR